MGVLLTCGVIAIIVSDRPELASAAAADAIDHGSLVPEQPQRGYPTIVYENTTDEFSRRPQTYAADLVDNYIVSGGNFTQITLQDGTTIDQAYLSIVDWRTKEQVCTDLDVDGEVLAVTAGPRPNTAFIAGRFLRATGPDGVSRPRNKVALIDMSTCSVDRIFASTGANDKISALALHGDRLFVGGDFTEIGGVSQSYLAELDPTTGATRSDFDVAMTSSGLSTHIRALGVDPGGSRLLLAGRFGSISDSEGNSISDSVTAIVDISSTTPAVTEHSYAYPHEEWRTRVFGTSLQGADIAPDGSTIALAFGTATISDYVYLVPTVESATDAIWGHYMRDTNFAVAISNNAVYVAGHFCKIDEGPGESVLSAPISGPSTCTGSNRTGGVWRTQLAALSLEDGTPLDWNPGNNALRGGASLTVIPRGLLVGFDGDRTNDVLTGTTAFFDFGAPDDPRTGQTCVATVNDDQSITVTWSDVDDVDSWSIRRNTQLVATVEGELTYSEAAPKGTHTYYIDSVLDENTWQTTCDPEVTTDGPAQLTCTATLDPLDGTVVLEWDEVAGASTYNVRRNTGWLATTADNEFTDSPPKGSHLYIIRTSVGGEQTSLECAPEITTDGPPTQTCSVTVDEADVVTVTFDEIAGEDTYIIRRNNGFVGQTGELSYTDSPGVGTHTYVIRSLKEGVQTDTACDLAVTIDAPPPVEQRCTATPLADGGVQLTWTSIDGEDTYNVARNDVFQATVTNALTWLDVDGTTADTWELRSRKAGVLTTTTCALAAQ